MSSFVNTDLASDSDSDDADFNPETEVNNVSEEELSGDEENPEKKPKFKGKNKRESGWPSTVFNSESKEEEKAIKKAFEKEKEDLKIEAEKQKTEDLWSGMYEIRFLYFYQRRIFRLNLWLNNSFFHRARRILV